MLGANLYILEGDGLTEWDRKAMNDPSITFWLGAYHYYLHPDELRRDMQKNGIFYVPPPDNLGILPALAAVAAFVAPIVAAGATTFIQVKGQQAIQDGQAKLYTEELKVLAAQQEIEEQRTQATQKTVLMGAAALVAGIALFKIL